MGSKVSRKTWTWWGIIVVVLIVAIVVAMVVFWFRTTEESDRSEQQQQEEVEDFLSSNPPVPENEEGSGDTGDTQIFGDNPLSGSSDQEVLTAAREFAGALVSDDYDSDEAMHSLIDPMLTPKMKEKFTTVSWYNTPSDEVAGATFRSKGTSDALVDVTFRRTTPLLRVYLVKEGDSWLVSDYGSRG